jgi:RNA polymerase sigma factor (sigma-70 family)
MDINKKTFEEYKDIFEEKTGFNFDNYYNKNKPKLIWLLMKYTRDKEVAEDFVQEAFIQSLNKIESYNNEFAYITWLSRIATNLVIREYKTRKRQDTISIDMTFNNDSCLSDYIEYDDGGIDKYSNKVVDTKAEIVKDAINNLSPKYKEVMTMREINRMSYKDIAYDIKIDTCYTIQDKIFNIPRTKDFIYLEIENCGDNVISVEAYHDNELMIKKIINRGCVSILTERDIKWLKHHDDKYIINCINSSCEVKYITSTNLSTVKSRIKQGRRILNKKLNKKFENILDNGID